MLKTFGLFIFLMLFALTGLSGEYRAIWVDTWNPGFLSRSQIDTLVARARDNNINTLVVEIRKAGDAYYTSDLVSRAENIVEADLDPLAYIIEKAHDTSNGKKRIEVHGWLVVNRVWKDPNFPQDSNHIYYQYPEWLSQNQNGDVRDSNGNYFLEMGVPAAAQHFVDVIAEVVENYPLDGINLDYVRYPETSGPWGYNPIAIERFESLYPDSGAPSESNPDWLQFKRDNVTQLVKQIYIEINRINPNVLLSADTITWGGVPANFANSSAYSQVFQDWVLWMQEGYVDINMPMIYKREHVSGQAQDYRDWVNFSLNHAYGRHFVAGVGTYLNTVNGSLDQINYALDAGADGMIFFSYNAPSSENVTINSFLATLKSECFSAWADPPASPWKDNPDGGYIAGKVFDPDGFSLENMDVTLVEPGQTITTEINGFFSFWNISPGIYTLSFESPDYGTVEQEVSVTEGEVEWLEFTFTRNLGRILLSHNGISYHLPLMITVQDGNYEGGTLSVDVKNLSTNEELSLLLLPVDNDRYEGELWISSESDDTILHAVHGEVLSITYLDEDDGTGESVLVEKTIVVDTIPPGISDFSTAHLAGGMVELTFLSDKTGLFELFLRSHAGNPFESIGIFPLTEGENTLPLDFLYPLTTYDVQIKASDILENTGLYPQQGVSWNFKTVQWITLLQENLDSNPDWQKTGAWEFGIPSGYEDTGYYYFTTPSSGFTGDYVYATNLEGAYSSNLENEFLYTPSVANTLDEEIYLSFYRWLSVENSRWDEAVIQVTNDSGNSWQNIWQNHYTDIHRDSAWTYCEYEISEHIDADSSFQIRWGLNSDFIVQLGGWYIDDIHIFQMYTGEAYDTDFDFEVTQADKQEVMQTGETGEWYIELRNTGNGIWFDDGVFQIRFLSGSDVFQIPENLPIFPIIMPGERVNFTLPVTAPDEPGDYELTFIMEKTLSGTFGEPYSSEIKVSTPGERTFAEKYLLF